MDYPVDGKTIRLFLGDIVTLEVDAIVNSANSDLWMGSGVAYAIAQAGGEIIETEARKHAPCPMGKVVVTTAGKLNAKHIIHAVIMEQDFLTDNNAITVAVYSAIAQADKLRLKTIAFPAMGVGVGLISSDLIAKILIDAVRKVLPETKSLRTVIFALLNEKIYRSFEKALPVMF